MADSPKSRILLIGANDKSMLSMARQCCLAGLSVDCADMLDIPFNYSRYINKYFRLPDYRLNTENFIAGLITLCAENKYAGAIFIHDDVLEVYMNHQSVVDKAVKVLCPPTVQQYELSHSKFRLIEYCRKLGFTVPATTLISSLQDLDNILPELTFPVIAKPECTAKLINNHLITLSVKKANNAFELIDFVREHIQNMPILLQQLVGGTGVGVNFLAKDGKLLNQYVHYRVREPLNGGVSSLRKVSGEDFLGLFDKLELLVKNTQWSGLGMLEFKVDGNDAYLMELNGRPWGSIEAGVLGGFNIPKEFINTFYLHKPTTGILHKNELKRQTLVLNSKLDLQYSLKEASRTKNPKPLLRWFYDTFLNPSVKVEDSLFRDPVFNLYNYSSILSNAVRKRIHNNNFKIQVQVIANKDIAGKKNIGYVCFGNICRSPFAEVYSAGKFQNYNFFSYGVYTEPNRLPPVNAALSAKKLGSDIWHHKSVVLDDKESEKMDVLVFMDKNSLARAASNFPQHVRKMFLISKEGVPDPYGTSIENFDKTYQVIADKVDFLFADSIIG